MADGRRLHLNDGPIDLIIEAFGTPTGVERAYRAAAARFDGLLDELCAELPALRRRAGADDPPLAGAVARRMQKAVAPFADETFVTPMAAVAGAVADEILATMVAAAAEALRRAYVNNGGDVAIACAPGESFTIGLVDRPDRPGLFGTTRIGHADGIGGVATSGARGRSFSLGIADAVTILARDAAEADAAATIVANAVDLPGDPRIIRTPARALQPDSDLGDMLVTRAVPALAPDDVEAALAAGVALAESLVARGLIAAAALHLQGASRTTASARLPTAPSLTSGGVHA